MSLPARQRRDLQRIEQALLADDAGLGSMFAVFTRLTAQEAMPRAEHVTSRLQRQLQRPAATMVIAVTALLGILVLALLTRSGQACGAASGARTGQTASARPAGCLPGTALPPGPSHAG